MNVCPTWDKRAFSSREELERRDAYHRKTEPCICNMEDWDKIRRRQHFMNPFKNRAWSWLDVLVLLVLLVGICGVLSRALAQAPPVPRITTSLPGIQDGKLIGVNFGTRYASGNVRGKVYVLAHYDMTALCNSDAGKGSQWLNFYQCKPPGSEALLPDEAISSWTATTVTITWPNAKLKAAFLKQLRLNPDQTIGDEFPVDSLAYSVETVTGARSEWK